MQFFQNLFYVLADIYLVLGIAVMLGLVFVLLKVKKSVEDVKKNVTTKIEEVTSLQPAKVASIMGMGVSAFLMHKVKGMFKKK